MTAGFAETSPSETLVLKKTLMGIELNLLARPDRLRRQLAIGDNWLLSPTFWFDDLRDRIAHQRSSPCPSCILRKTGLSRLLWSDTVHQIRGFACKGAPNVRARAGYLLQGRLLMREHYPTKPLVSASLLLWQNWNGSLCNKSSTLT